MPEHLQRDLSHLKEHLLAMGRAVEEAINKAIESLESRDPELAAEVRRGDGVIDNMEVEIEEECLKILALYQPVATDLRFVVSVMKVNNDLERMGDLACSIAGRAKYLSIHPPLNAPLDFRRMLDLVREMVRDSLQCLVNRDTELARGVLARDDDVDDINAAMFFVVEELVKDDPDALRRSIHLLSASRALERIADLATNIVEDVIFLVEGEVVRHQPGAPPENQDR